MFLSRCQYQNKKALFTDPICSEGFGYKSHSPVEPAVSQLNLKECLCKFAIYNCSCQIQPSGSCHAAISTMVKLCWKNQIIQIRIKVFHSYFKQLHSVSYVYAVLPFYDVKCLCSRGRE